MYIYNVYLLNKMLYLDCNKSLQVLAVKNITSGLDIIKDILSASLKLLNSGHTTPHNESRLQTIAV